MAPAGADGQKLNKWFVSLSHPLTQVVLTSLRQMAIVQTASAATACNMIEPWRSLSRVKFTMPSTRITSGVITITAKKKNTDI
ncbi:MAG: hypothetical protein QOI77_2511 [Blastocatellia bacterium]|nr:hypothetical protein [Blastocatellia bacterium]